jgi:hypothetical protein
MSFILVKETEIQFTVSVIHLTTVKLQVSRTSRKKCLLRTNYSNNVISKVMKIPAIMCLDCIEPTRFKDSILAMSL